MHRPGSILRTLLVAALALLIASPLAHAQSAPSFAVTDLIRIVEEGAEAYTGRVAAINNDGVIIGYSGHLPAKWSPFTVTDGEVTWIPSGELGASMTDINDNGVIVGRTVTERSEELGALGLPTMWVDGEPTELAMPVGPAGLTAYTGIARAINNDGVIVGEAWFDDEFQTQYAVIWIDGVPSALPNAFAYDACMATDISENGAIAGQCWNPNFGEWQATAWIDQQVAILDHGTYGFGYAASIVDDPVTGLPYVVGEVASTQNEPEDTHAAIWDLTVLGSSPAYAPLGELAPPDGMSYCSGAAVAIADGEIWTVGYCSTPDGTDDWPTFGMLWIGGDQGLDLNELATDAGSLVIELPFDVNSDGSITANATKGDVIRGVVLHREE